MAKIYQKIGLRRNNNLGDVPNPREGLSNLLNNVTSDDFDADDLLLSLDGIYNEGLETSSYNLVSGSAELFTTADAQTSAVKPYVTYQNKLDLSETYAGTPRLYGGNGLTAKYYNKSQVAIYNEDPAGIEDRTDVWYGDPFKEDNFWEMGNFVWNQKLHEQSATVGGGIEWEGYYVPREDGDHSFSIVSTGAFTFDFQKIDYSNAFSMSSDEWLTSSQTDDISSDVYKEYARVGISSIISCSNVLNSTSIIKIDDPTNLAKYVGIGMSVVGAPIVNGDEAGITISEFNQVPGSSEYGYITLSTPDSGNAVTDTSFQNVNLTFTRENDTSCNKRLYIDYPLVATVPYRIKIRYFLPQVWDETKSERTMNVNEHIPTGASSDNLNYRALYSLDYDFSNSAKGSFSRYVDTSILFGGGTIGVDESGNATSTSYVSIIGDKKIDARYDPINLTLTNDYGSSTGSNGVTYPYKKIEVGTITRSVSQGNGVLSVSDTTGMEIGNYVYDDEDGGSGTPIIPEGTRIAKVIINQALILTNTFTSTNASRRFKVIEHRGHIKRVTGNISAGSLSELTINTTSHTNADIKKDMLIVGPNTTINTKVTSTSSNNKVFLSDAATDASGTNQSFYFYDYQGLVNYSLDAFCTPTTNDNICVTARADVNAGTGVKSIPIYDPRFTSFTSNYKLLGYYFKYNADGTPKTSFDSISGSSGSYILNISEDLDKNIKEGNNFTVALNPGTATCDGETIPNDKGLCCPPKDTSPPFEATDDGMRTVASNEMLNVYSGNLIFDNIRSNIQTSDMGTIGDNKILETATSTQYDTINSEQLNRRIHFLAGDGNIYRLFSKEV